MKPPKLSIYALRCPRSGEYRYVGATRRNPSLRLEDHWRVRELHNTLGEWFSDLAARSLVPEIQVLETTRDPLREDHHHQRLIAEGHPVMNRFVRIVPDGTSKQSAKRISYLPNPALDLKPTEIELEEIAIRSRITRMTGQIRNLKRRLATLKRKRTMERKNRPSVR